ncbi:universal stress protein [Rhodopirellula sallentina]|uniref:UspA domain-containing protein n=1 Tax=Rhodopirellula sallentina SM41 TaxID=1263870 RepID=M5U452_9BACT|nr:universal stress protein [Rhodopirellula sallentina]EMI56059.1 UspA domain-containing protein [Rhodopirellula sallentina SM41]
MKRYHNILVYAGTQHRDSAVTRAAQLAMENHASLTLMDVVKPMPSVLGLMTEVAKPDEIERLVAADRKRRLMEIASEISDIGVQIDVCVAIGDAATEITRRVIDDDHDLVVKNADAFSPTGRLFGSIGASLLRICPCPVMLLKPQLHGEFDQIVAAIDVESTDQVHRDLNRQILEHAYSIALRDKATLHVVAAWQLWMEDAILPHAGSVKVEAMRREHHSRVQSAIDELLQAPFADADDVRVHLRQGGGASVIRDVADEVEADLMVMGTVCRTGIAGVLIGNTAETVLSDINCSLLALKPDGFQSPVQRSGSVFNEEDEPLPLV